MTMVIREGKEEDYGQLASLFASFFKTHDAFQKDKETIARYLQREELKHDLIVFEEEGVVKGALFLVKKGENVDGSHQRWKFRHFAFETERIAEELLNEGERRVREKSSTIKIELTLAENEEGLDFYKRRGYSQEGMLTNHYRWGETCYVLGKSFN